jgi:uncharacterized membrane protein YkoI
MRTRQLLFASALVLTTAAGALALNGIQTTHAADSSTAGKTGQTVQQQAPSTKAGPAADRDDRRGGDRRNDGDDMRRGDRDDAGAVQTSQQAMPLENVIREVNRQGYTDLRKVEREGRDYYEVYARDSSGRRVELKVDAMTGKVMHREYDD